MPDARIGVGAIESSSHGTVLWVAMDHGCTRIGISLPPDRFAKFQGQMTEEDAKNEALEALAAFKVQFLRVDWWTCYRYENPIVILYGIPL